MPLQNQNYSCDINKIIPDLYSWVQGALLLLPPAERAMPQGRALFLSPFTLLTPAGTVNVKFAAYILISKCSLTSGSRQQNR